MIDYYNIIIGVCLLILGYVLGMPAIKDELNKKSDEYGARKGLIFSSIGFIIIGLVMILEQLF